ncbi:MAG TPA: sigma-70 family RNA polymerase sigma factor [Thermoanaerobaculia bacterium]|jgi:RNA polymerase sigma-70 factor (ECF subfamily)|nr:sigma-70 family RNA polymerase sigma factor [Thermoanaerobaculia bacterium]
MKTEGFDTHEGDRDLVRRMLAGEEDAFRHFFEGHFPGLYRFALARLGHDADAAEEVAQSALCKVVRKLHTYRGEASLFTWVCTFCRWEISAWHAQRGRRGVTVELVEESAEVRGALESLSALGMGGPRERLLRQEVADLVRLTLDQLPSRYGDALEWKYVEGLSVKEIAVRLGVGPKAAESLLTRARQAFRDAFATLSPNLEGVQA